ACHREPGHPRADRLTGQGAVRPGRARRGGVAEAADRRRAEALLAEAKALRLGEADALGLGDAQVLGGAEAASAGAAGRHADHPVAADEHAVTRGHADRAVADQALAAQAGALGAQALRPEPARAGPRAAGPAAEREHSAAARAAARP